MLNLLAQATPSFWNGAPNSAALWTNIAIAFVVSALFFGAILAAPAQMRRWIVAFFTFFAGLFWVLVFVFPRPIDRQPDEIPLGPVDGFGFWLQDAIPVVNTATQVLTAFLLGLGVYSLLTIHGRRLFKMQRDWAFSLVFLLSMAAMLWAGYADWFARQAAGARLDEPVNWGFANYAKDLLFDGMLQNLDAAMFSIIAFFILSAAYRAFRIRSVEATILLAAAFIVMLSLMGAVEFVWGGMINRLAGETANMTVEQRAAVSNSLLQNLSLTEIAGWLRNNVQVAAVRGIDFGVGIGALAMALRLWLSLEKGVGS